MGILIGLGIGILIDIALFFIADYKSFKAYRQTDDWKERKFLDPEYWIIPGMPFSELFPGHKAS